MLYRKGKGKHELSKQVNREIQSKNSCLKKKTATKKRPLPQKKNNNKKTTTNNPAKQNQEAHKKNKKKPCQSKSSGKQSGRAFRSERRPSQINCTEITAKASCLFSVSTMIVLHMLAKYGFVCTSS